MDCLAAEYAEILLYFPELQKSGDFPRQFKRPHMEAANQRPHHDVKRSQASWKNRLPQEKQETQTGTMSRSSRERDKHRKFNRCHDEDEDFPRGPKIHSTPGTFKFQRPHKSLQHSHHHKPREDKMPKEGKRGKQGKHRKKESCLDEDYNDNLFLIKQRKKKSKL